MSTHHVRALGIACLAGVALAAGPGHAASRLPPAQPSSMDALLAEVRAMRAELNHVAGASIRTQLLVARLQVQEQRINTILQQLNRVREELSTIAQTRTAFGAQLKMFDEDAKTTGVPAEGDKVMHPLRSMLAEQEKRENELKAQEAALEGHLATEQSRWSEFNDRLDAVERELQTPPRR
jgi:chromosome segregation ATPase